MELYESVGGKVSTLLSEIEQKDIVNERESSCDCKACCIKKKILPYCFKMFLTGIFIPFAFIPIWVFQIWSMIANRRMYQKEEDDDPFSDDNEIGKYYDWDQHVVIHKRLLTWAFRCLLCLAFQASIILIIVFQVMIK